ncbi:Uncharacterized protein APZ42_033057 [Daphnia magna]|uniref:Uncharacterized protein n=1 Tax=Daphnia magna TaxID=35525 RepID=A0A164LH92_9CRUS|nr:Uncharacterized protein APZ42_033057 [Daphnia magna]
MCTAPLHDILDKLYASQFIKRTFGGKTPMKPKLVIAWFSYILPKLVSEDNPCVSVNRISDGPSKKTIYTYKFQSYNKEDLEKIPQRDCKSKKTSSYRRKTPVQSSDLAVKEILPYSPPITPSPVFTIPGAKTLPASTPNSFERKLPHSASTISHLEMLPVDKSWYSKRVLPASSHINKVLPASSSVSPLPVPTSLMIPETLRANTTISSDEKNSNFCLQNGSSEDIPGDSPEDIPGDSPDDIPEESSEDIPVDSLEDIPGEIYIHFIVLRHRNDAPLRSNRPKFQSNK